MTTLALARASIRGSTFLSPDGVRELARRQKPWVIALAGVGATVGLGMFQLLLVNMYRGLVAMGSATGHPELALFYGLAISWVFLFVTGIPVALSLLAYSKDIQLLRALPLRPGQIVGAKALLLYLYSLPVGWYFLLPAIVLSARPLGVTVAFVAAAVAHLVVSPMLPVALAVFAVLGLMRVVDLSRYRTALEMAGMFLALALVIGLQTLLSRATVGTFKGTTIAGLGELPNIYGALARALPPVAWAASAFVSGSLTALAPSVGLTAACAVLAYAAAPLGFLRDPGERSSARARHRRGATIAAVARPRATSRRSALIRSLVRREWSILSSNSTFLFEAFGELAILPLLLGIYSLILPKPIIQQALTFVTAGAPWIGAAILAVLVLMTNLTTISATSISREGQRFALSLVIPVAGRTQVLAKLALHLSMFGPVFLLDCAIVLYLFRLSPLVLLYYLPTGFAFMLVGFCAGIFFELKRPLLKWTHPQQAMKNNVNALAAMGATAGLLAVLAVPSALLLARGLSPYLLGLIVAAIAAAAAAAALPRLLVFADRQYGGGLEVTA